MAKSICLTPGAIYTFKYRAGRFTFSVKPAPDFVCTRGQLRRIERDAHDAIEHLLWRTYIESRDNDLRDKYTELAMLRAQTAMKQMRKKP